MELESGFKVGDVVIHKSNPEIMWVVIFCAGKRTVDCTTVTRKGKLRSYTFDVEEIKKLQ